MGEFGNTLNEEGPVGEKQKKFGARMVYTEILCPAGLQYPYREKRICRGKNGTGYWAVGCGEGGVKGCGGNILPTVW